VADVLRTHSHEGTIEENDDDDDDDDDDSDDGALDDDDDEDDGESGGDEDNADETTDIDEKAFAILASASSILKFSSPSLERRTLHG
jgi:hypothetical protein